MACERVEIPGVGTAIICSRGRRSKPDTPRAPRTSKCVRCKELFTPKSKTTMCQDCITDLGG